ncbi:MAG: HDIG domain-containing protein [Gemmatimonadetes bacterium]|nr:HDIG domain-containing protein [Gemmatimonadota bacterium]
MTASEHEAGLRHTLERFRKSRTAYHGARWLPLVGLALLTYALYPVTQGFTVEVPEVGAVALEEIVAPFAFVVPKTESEIQQEADDLASRVNPIYEYRAGVSDSIATRIDALFIGLDTSDSADAMITVAQGFGVMLTGEEASYLGAVTVRSAFRRSLRRMVTIYLARGVAAPGTVRNELNNEVMVRRAGSETLILRDSVSALPQYLDLAAREHPDPNSAVGNQLFVRLLNTFFQATLTPNVVETEGRRLSLRNSVQLVKDSVRQDERIINNHEIVTPQARDRLLALQQALVDQGRFDGAGFQRTLGQVLTNGIVLAVFWLLLMLYLPNTYREIRHMCVFAALFAIVIIGAAVNHRFINEGPELIPIPFAALVMTVLFNGRIAMVAAIVLAVLLGSQVAYGGQDAFYIALLGGVTAALSVRRISRRTEILASTAFVAVAFVLAAVTVGLRVGWSAGELGLSVVRGAANATVSAALVFMVMPIFERWTHITTDLTLLELSDPNHPLLRRLATEVPGTYAHSVAMANLSEGACNAIGAAGLLARVGCYYHDVGKLQKPLHFVENQGVGGNPHDRLPPDVSATIIRNHVIAGMALADEHRLPKPVKAFIPEHHGTAEISYFLDRARKNGEVPEEALESFRYPGPRPQSVETAVCMLADGVEAALRVIDEPSPQKLRGAIDHVVQQRIDAKQLDEAPITLGQIERVKDEFVRILSGMHHNRLDYPEEAGGITADWKEPDKT